MIDGVLNQNVWNGQANSGVKEIEIEETGVILKDIWVEGRLAT